MDSLVCDESSDRLLKKDVTPAKRESRRCPPYQVRGKLCETCSFENREQGTRNIRNWVPVFTGNPGFLLPQE
jgi:hypothetical protein